MTTSPRGASKTFEATDPLELVGVSYPVASREEQDRTMGRCFIEEYALMGWNAERIRTLFLSPVYAGPHGILRRQGMPFVDTLVHEVIHGEAG
jgi:hypothetical protein